MSNNLIEVSYLLVITKESILYIFFVDMFVQQRHEMVTCSYHNDSCGCGIVPLNSPPYGGARREVCCGRGTTF